MRDLGENFKQHLQTGATSLCRAWVVERKDGVVFGFTDHDSALDLGGVVCEPSDGMNATAVESGTGLSVDNAQVIGALRSDRITEEDVAAGLYDYAQVTQYVMNWQDSAQNAVLFSGSFGEIKRGSGAFEAELRGLSEDLNTPTGRAYLRQCDAQLGDSRCKAMLDVPAYRGVGEVTFVEGARVVHVKALAGFEADWFELGQGRFMSGENADQLGFIKMDRLQGVLRIIEFWEDFRGSIAVGDQIELTAGCDKLQNTCTQKFANFLNFRGFPHMPGDDWAVSYPVRGGDNSGGSLS